MKFSIKFILFIKTKKGRIAPPFFLCYNVSFYYLRFLTLIGALVTRAIIRMISTMPRMIASGIHRGESTHHQDHVIYPVSFKVMKIRVRIERNGKLFVAVVVV
jgi:hypothetical protein